MFLKSKKYWEYEVVIMKKRIALRGILGLPIGITIGYFITILTSLIWGNGYYSPCTPELIALTGSEISAVLVQTILCGILGAGCAAGSVIWEIEHWGIAKQTGIYFLLLFIIMMPIAYITHWMEHSLSGFMSYFGTFALIFILIWIIEYMIEKHNIDKINAKLNKEE